MSDNYNFEINLGESLTVAVQWLDDTETPMDLTGWTASLLAPSLSLTLSLTVDALGNITGNVLDTTAWTVGEHAYTLQTIDGTGNIDFILQGKICVHNVPVW